MSIRSSIQALPPYAFTAYDQPIKLDQNENPHDLPPNIKAEVFQRLNNTAWNRYPEVASESLCQKIADLNNWDVAGVAVTAGSNIMLKTWIEACAIGQRLLTVAPTFSVYRMQGKILGVAMTELPLEPDFSLPAVRLEQELQQGTGLLILANPAAPTANLHPEQHIIQLIEAAQKNDWTVLLDEAYYQFAAIDQSHMVKTYPHVVITRTFSKALGLAGVRLGYCLGAADRVEQLRKIVMPFSVSSLQQVIGDVILDHADISQSYIDKVISERERISQALQKLNNVHPYPSATNFILFTVPNPAETYQHLQARGVLVRRQDHLVANALRMSVGTQSENDSFLAEMKRLHT